MLSYRIKIFFFLLLGLSSHSLHAQNVSGENNEFFYDRPYLLILLSTGFPQGNLPFEQEVLDTVTCAVSLLGSFDIIDPAQVTPLLNEYKIPSVKSPDDSTLIRIGNLVYANEIMIIDVRNFSQHSQNSAQREESSNISEQNMTMTSDSIPVGMKAQEDTIQLGKYFQTDILINIRIIGVDNSQSLENFAIEVSHTDTTLAASKSGALKKLRTRTTSELRNIYLLAPEIIKIKNNQVYLNRGSGAGIRKGMLFIIRSPDQWEEYYDQTEIIPGKEIGLLSVQKITEQQTVANLLRQTGYVGPGFRVFEYPESIYGLRINFSPGLADSMMSIGAQFFWRPLQRWHYGCGLRVIQITDSQGDKNYGFGMEGLGGIHLYRILRINVGAIMALNIDLPFKYDDNNNTVFLPILSSEIGMRLNITYFWKSDISIIAGYRIAVREDNWQISSEEENVGPVYWEDNPPAVNISGFFIQAGYTFLLFRR